MTLYNMCIWRKLYCLPTRTLKIWLTDTLLIQQGMLGITLDIKNKMVKVRSITTLYRIIFNHIHLCFVNINFPWPLSFRYIQVNNLMFTDINIDGITPSASGDKPRSSKLTGKVEFVLSRRFREICPSGGKCLTLAV